MNQESHLEGYLESDSARDKDDNKSTSSYLFTLSGAALCWKSRKQKLIVLSNREVDYIPLTETAKEASRLRNLFAEISSCFNIEKSSLQGTSIPIYADNQASIYMAKIPQLHE